MINLDLRLSSLTQFRRMRLGFSRQLTIALPNVLFFSGTGSQKENFPKCERQKSKLFMASGFVSFRAESNVNQMRYVRSDKSCPDKEQNSPAHRPN